MPGSRRLPEILTMALAVAAPMALPAQETADVGPPPTALSRHTPPTSAVTGKPEGSPIPGARRAPEAPAQNDFTTPDGFTHFHLDVNSDCLFTDHNYSVNVPLDPARLSQISYLMTNYDVDYNDPQDCLGGPEVDLMWFNGNILGILAGATDSWSINKWNLGRSNITNGANDIHIDTDFTATGCWCVGVGYVEIIAKVDFKVRSFTPANKDKNRDFHANKADITGTFTIEYDTATLDANTFKVEYRDAAGAWQQVPGGFTQLAPEKFRFTPGADLKDGIRYRATLVGGDNGVKAKAGGAKLPNDRVWYFWTVPDLSVNDAFDYGLGTTCPPSVSPCPGLELNVFQVAANKNMVPNKRAVARIYHRWKHHADVFEDDQVKEVLVKDDLGAFGRLRKTVKRPDRYKAAEKVRAENTVNIYHTPAASFNYSLECTPLPQTNATLVKFNANRNLASAGASPRMKFDYYFLRDGAWSGGVPASAKTAGRRLMTSGALLITDQFPVLGTQYREKGNHSIGYTMTGMMINDAGCGMVNEVNCPAAGTKKELECAQLKMSSMLGGHQFVAATASNTLCPNATGFRMGRVFFHMHPSSANDGTIAHEVGHVFGISKANSPTFRHRNSSTGVEGFQVRLKRNKSFTENLGGSISLMHTTVQPAGSQWIHNDDYDALLAAGIAAPAPEPENGPEVVGPYLIVSGYADDVTAQLSSAFLQEVPNDASDPAGTHTVELLDGGNNVLSSAGVTPGIEIILEGAEGIERTLGPPALTPYFSVSLPWGPTAQKIRVRKGASTLLTVNRTAQSPAVTLTAPGEGASLSGTVPVTWSGSDGDSASLFYQVQLSEDGGASWSPLIPLTDTTSFSFDTTLVSSGLGRKLRVMVTDGFNTAYDTRNVGITNPLVVAAVDPPDGETGVATDSTVGVTFGTPVNPATLFAGFKMVVQGETTGLIGTLSYDSAIQTVVFQPQSRLQSSKTYVVSLTGVQDVNGNALAAPYQWSFTTAPDTVAPLVAFRSPAPGDLDVPVSAIVTAGFNEVMKSATVNGSSFTVTGPGGAVAGTVFYNTIADQAVFLPSAPLSPNTTYTVQVTTAVQDFAGNPLEAADTWSFTTGTLNNTSRVRLLDNYSDEAVDENGDGLFDRLYVYCDFEVKVAGTYNLNGRLLDKDGNLIEWKASPFFGAIPGVYTFYIDFTGSVIRGHNVNGPYTLDSLSLYNYDTGESDTRFEVYQTLPYQVSEFHGIMTFSGLPDQVVEKGTTKNDAFNLRNYTTHQTQPVSSVTYTIFINSNPAVGVSIDGSANIDINPGPSVTAESDVTIEAKDTLGNAVHSTFHVGVEAASLKTLSSTLPPRVRPNGSQDITIDIYDQFGRLFTSPATVDFQSTFGTMTPPSVQTSNGHATSNFSPGGQTGPAFITVTSGAAENHFSILSGYLAGDINPTALLVDPVADGGFSDGNGIFEPGEKVFVRPSWTNATPASASLTGAASLFTGPAGPTYTLNDSAADYGTIPSLGTHNCSSTANCYEMSVSNPLSRPATHWDATFTETLSGVDPLLRKLHVGQSFPDVPKNHVFYPFVERLLHNGVTTGCSATAYCPDNNVFRLQMAIFIARSQAGSDAAIPVSGSAQGNPYNCVSGGQSQFTDLPPTDPFCRHVHYIFSTGVTTGCVTTPPRQYCPADNVTRGQMALFIARAVAGSDAAVPVTYGPDPVTGRSYSCNPATPNRFFTDIATGDIFCRHVHYLWARNVISGFPDGTFGPGLAVTRGAMSKFLANGFNMKLY